MKLNLNVDFCIIENPIIQDDTYMIYFTRRNYITLDFSLREEPLYKELVTFLSNLGYLEIDYLAFQFVDNTDKKKKQLSLDDIMTELVNLGAEYSSQLQDVIVETIEKLKKELNGDFDEEEKQVIQKNKFKIPKVGERLSPYFYLFLECFFASDSECFLRLNGDFRSKENSNTRNFLGIINTEFKRVSCEKKGYYRFESCKSGAELIKFIPFLQGGHFNITVTDTDDEDGRARKRTKTFFYSILDIKRKIRSIDRIMIEIPKKTFQGLMEISTRVKLEKKIADKENVEKEDIVSSFNILKGLVKNRMLNYAAEEEFRKAAELKKDLKFIEKKENFYSQSIDRDITYKEYKKLFCFS